MKKPHLIKQFKTLAWIAVEPIAFGEKQEKATTGGDGDKQLTDIKISLILVPHRLEISC